MTLITQIKDDQLQARKDRNTTKATLLTTLFSEAAMVGKNDGNRETTDAEVIAVIKKFVKNNLEVIGNLSEDDDRYVIATHELVFMNNYLPKQLTNDELRDIITPLAEGKTMRDMGGIMKELKANYTGLYDGRAASTIIKGVLK